MPTALGGNDVDRINQLMARFSMNGGGGGLGQPLGAMNMYAGYQKGDDLTDHLMMIDNQRKGGYQRTDGSPAGGLMGLTNDATNWNRSSSVGGGGLTGSAMPHPMMMMPGQQNLMTNYFTPGLMTKTPSHTLNYMNTDYASLPPAINQHLLLLEEEDGDALDGGGLGGGGINRGQMSLNEKLR